MAVPEKYDAIVIGTGQSGVPLAKTLAHEGWKTAIIERYFVGGSCINYGCTPSKTMAASSSVIYKISKAEAYGIYTSKTAVNLRKIIDRKRGMVKSFREGLEKGIKKTINLILIRGDAGFINKKVIKINLNDGGFKLITADKIFINTGGHPVIPEIDGIDTIDYLTSASVMSWKKYHLTL